MRTTALYALALVALALPAQAGPVLADGGSYGFTVSISNAIAVTPGNVGFVPATLQNTGTLALTFQVWDPSLWKDGYGWNSFDTDLMWRTSGSTLTNASARLASGHTETFDKATLAQVPDYSALSGVTIAPGATLDFDMFSIWVDPATQLGVTGTFSVFGEWAYAGYFQSTGIVSPIKVTWIASGEDAATGPKATAFRDPLALPPMDDPRSDSAKALQSQALAVPEPATTVLFGLGLVAICAFSGRRRGTPSNISI